MAKFRFRFITAAACVRISLLASAATLLGFAGLWWWPFELLTHFRLHYASVLLPFFAGSLVVRRYVAATLAGVCLIINLAYILPAYFGSGPSAGGEVGLRLMSANVRRSNRDYERFFDYVTAADPDVLLVMEIDSGWAKALERLSAAYPHGESAPRADSFGIALLSKVPLDESAVKYWGAAYVPSIEATLEIKGGNVTIIGTHPLPPIRGNAALRNEQLDLVAEAAAGVGGAVVVAGDLNATPWSPFFRRLLDRAGLQDSRLGFGNQATWPSRLGAVGIPIDHILISSEVRVLSRRVGPHFGSDHRPVVAEISITE